MSLILGLNYQGDNVDVVKWSCIEIASAVICACLPALRPLLGRFLPKVFGKTEHTGPSSGKVTANNAKLSRERLQQVGERKMEAGMSLECLKGDAISESRRWSDDAEDTELVFMEPRNTAAHSVQKVTG